MRFALKRASRDSLESQVVLLGLLAVLLCLFLKIAVLDRAMVRAAGPVALGVYDPAQAFVTAEAVDIEHHFVTWRLNNTEELVYALDQAVSRGRLPLITIEPWPWSWNGMTSQTLLKDVASGKYDETAIAIFQVIQRYAPQQIVLRWGHEMEIADQYPWSKVAAKNYVAAYRHIVDLARWQGLDNVLWMWSPAGNHDAKAYWPGDDYVDQVGVSIYATKEWNLRSPEKLPSFAQLMRQKYWLAQRYNKPFVIAEVGVAGAEAEKEAWMQDAIASLPRFPRIQAWVYFNQRQPDIVPLEIGQPQWQLSERDVQQLVDQWQQAYPKIAD